jgi:hypothetical protein
MANAKCGTTKSGLYCAMNAINKTDGVYYTQPTKLFHVVLHSKQNSFKNVTDYTNVV